MNSSVLLLTVLALMVFSWLLGHKRARTIRHHTHLHSLPRYHGSYLALWCGLPALAVLLIWSIFSNSVIDARLGNDLVNSGLAQSQTELGLKLNEVKLRSEQTDNIQIEEPIIAGLVQHYKTLKTQSKIYQTVLAIIVALAGAAWGYSRIQPHTRARNGVEQTLRYALMAASFIAILTTVGIVMSVLFESLRFFQSVPVTEFLFGTHWSPQTAIREDQVGSSGSFGAVPLLAGTFLISLIALSVAIPFGLMSAIYLSEYASTRFRSIAKPTLELLAGIPTVVYGFFAALTVGPFIRFIGESLGLDTASESALAAGLVMGVMIIPFISSLSDDVINAVPQAMRDGAYALGGTQSETIRQVIIPAALPGIVGGIMLAASRAIGETMIVVMAAGLSANMTANPLQAVTTVTVQIVTLLTGDQEFDSTKTLAAFALGLLLFLITLLLNVVALGVVRKYREQYE